MSKYSRAEANNCLGVYYYSSTKRVFAGRAERCYVVTYKAGKRKVWEKVGWESEGISPQHAANYRRDKLLGLRLHKLYTLSA